MILLTFLKEYVEGNIIDLEIEYSNKCVNGTTLYSKMSETDPILLSEPDIRDLMAGKGNLVSIWGFLFNQPNIYGQLRVAITSKVKGEF